MNGMNLPRWQFYKKYINMKYVETTLEDVPIVAGLIQLVMEVFSVILKDR